MAAWHYIKGRWWIFIIATVPFVLIGSALIILDTVADSTPGWDPPWYNSMLFLGVLFIVFPLAGMWWTLRSIKRGQRIEREMLERSIPGRAVVISIMETGLCSNDVPELEITLEVVTEMYSAYRVVHREHINLIDLPKLRPGEEIDVRVDSRDRQNILIGF